MLLDISHLARDQPLALVLLYCPSCFVEMNLPSDSSSKEHSEEFAWVSRNTQCLEGPLWELTH